MVVLTDEQRAIVEHYQGAAIVYAVAGAGKSTTMAHRVQHLVEQYHINPTRILVCSFSRETVNDIKQKIESLGVQNTSCYTFNALGRRIVQHTIKQGYFPNFDESQIEFRSSQLAMRALVELGKQLGQNFNQLDVNQEDLQTFISICKGNLAYADLLEAKLPIHCQQWATQATNSNPYYLKAYKLYEQIRQQQNLLTFDDQLLLAWEALERFDEIRTWAKSSFDFVLVDEFQDVNKVQAQIADILTEDHRNYMAIGDDDQCIYEWRGADVRFILDFKKRYHATEFIISDNFRCPAEVTLLAGQVIAKNTDRHLKDLVSQRGFGGNVQLKGFQYDSGVAHYVVEEYKKYLAQGGNAADCMILVRSYSQTAMIEAKLIQEDLAYQIIGNPRFYERPEVKVLFTYLGFARQEADYRKQQNGQLTEQYIRRFGEILRQPNRYLSQQWINEFLTRGQQQNGSLVDFLANNLHLASNEASQKRLEKLAYTLKELSKQLEHDAGSVVSWLVNELDYFESIKKNAAIPELGEERCQNIHALINYAQKKGTVLAFLAHLRRLHLEDEQGDNSKPRLQMMSIHRAKGLEWPVVFVPCCAEEQLPSSHKDNLEEERRLLYVAMTRSKQHLHLLYAPQDKMSSFLKTVQAEQVLKTATELKELLNNSANTVQPQQMIHLALAVKQYPLMRYLRCWWPASTDFKQHLWQQAELALAQQQSAQLQIGQLKTQISEQNSLEQQQKDLKSMERRLLLFKARHVTVLLNQTAADNIQQQRFYFELNDSSGVIAVLNQTGQKIGIVDKQASRFPLEEVLDWSWLMATVTIGFRFSYLKRTMNVTLQLSDNVSTLKKQKELAVPLHLQYLASESFKEDMQQLMGVLNPIM
ncbi:MAG TPA: ATP-dependent helicase [Agitococcus sp.]|nr:ATP-dependent helicase [Agitococcus sp.]